MKLVQFCQEYGLNIAVLDKKDVATILGEGFLNQKQADELLAELNWVDSLWQLSIPDTKCADFLW